MIKLNEIKDYVLKLYEIKQISDRAFPSMLFSAVSTKFVPFEEINNFRYRINLFFEWSAGYFKSSLFNFMRNLIRDYVKINLLTTSTSAALRGSWVDGKYFAPEFAISDIIIIPEMSLISNDDETMAQFLIAMEDAKIRVALIKAKKRNVLSENDVLKYGGVIKDDRLEYRVKSLVWIASHTIDNIKNTMIDAFLSRCLYINIPLEEIPLVVGAKDYTLHRNLDFEAEISQSIGKALEVDREPNHQFAQKVVDRIKNSFEGRVNPRVFGDIRRISIAYNYLYPKATVSDVALECRKLINIKSIRKTRDIIADLITMSPKTFKEIQELTGVSKSTLYGHLSRLHALRVKDPITRVFYYYLEGLPPDFEQYLQEASGKSYVRTFYINKNDRNDEVGV